MLKTPTQYNYLKIWVSALLILTAVLFTWHHYGMNRVINIDDFDNYRVWTFDDRNFGGGSVASVEQKPGEFPALKCQFKQRYAWPFCDLNIDLGGDNMGLDLSGFDTIELDIDTDSNAVKPVRIFLRNYNPVYSKPGDPESLKVNELNYDPTEEPRPFIVELNKFQVAIWWINEHLIPPKHAGLDLSNIVTIGIGFTQSTNEETYRILPKAIRFHGKWISYTKLQSIIIAAWICSALIFLLINFWQTQKAMAAIRVQNKGLEEINAALELKRTELENLATHDPLTGIYNRVGLRNHLHAQSSLVKQNKSALAIIFMDIDYYKEINDRHGHDVGDDVLKKFVDLVSGSIRSQDVFCRWGGDEFILLCHGTPLDSATYLAEKLRSLIMMRAWPRGVKLTCSFGVAQLDPDEPISDFIKRADQALYEAKAAGRNQAVSAPAGNKPGAHLLRRA
jgi:diguanylate cyclase (GGDEF)-like protein